MDLKCGYSQIEVDELDRENMAFITPDGLDVYQVWPFGLGMAPATFLAGLNCQTCLVYLDDVVVFSDNFQEQFQRLTRVSEVIRKAGMFLKAEMCGFGHLELKFLGRVVSAAGVRSDADNCSTVANVPAGKNKKPIRRFVGLCSHYRRLVFTFFRIDAPLTQLTKNDEAFMWGADQEEAFEDLKNLCVTAPLLNHFDEYAAIAIYTDASIQRLGSNLVEIQDSVERVIEYASRTLPKPQDTASTTEKESVSVVKASTKFQPCLYGNHISAVMGHYSLYWLAGLRYPSGRLARWNLSLQEHADCSSRTPAQPPPSIYADGDDVILGTLDGAIFGRWQ